MAGVLKDNPGFEFLAECWNDDPALQIVVKKLVAKDNGSDEGTSRWMKAAGIAIDEEHYRKVANPKDIDRRTYNSRQHQDYLKPEEVLECEKFRIQDTYGMSVTPELVEQDDGGRLIKNRTYAKTLSNSHSSVTSATSVVRFPLPVRKS